MEMVDAHESLLARLTALLLTEAQGLCRRGEFPVQPLSDAAECAGCILHSDANTCTALLTLPAPKLVLKQTFLSDQLTFLSLSPGVSREPPP